MRKLIVGTLTYVALITAYFIYFASPAKAFNCGFEPFKPLNCVNGHYTCQCDQYGQCQWILLGC